MFYMCSETWLEYHASENEKVNMSIPSNFTTTGGAAQKPICWTTNAHHHNECLNKNCTKTKLMQIVCFQARLDYGSDDGFIPDRRFGILWTIICCNSNPCVSSMGRVRMEFWPHFFQGPNFCLRPGAQVASSTYLPERSHDTLLLFRRHGLRKDADDKPSTQIAMGSAPNTTI